ncbi:MAG: hypothetical protein ACKO23_04795 [Gemmataceae bacterium]
MQRAGILLSVCCALFLGCEEQSDPPSPAPPTIVSSTPAIGSATIHGSVDWTGPVPRIVPFRSIPDPFTDQKPPPVQDWPNPNQPRISKDGRLLSAIVWLEGAHLEAGKPWQSPPVQVELSDDRMTIVQDGVRGNLGLVKTGSSVEFVSRQKRYHHVDLRGADFFSLALPDPDRPFSRRFQRSGVVELLSAAGQFWMRSYLVVSDHPFVARLDARGCFRFTEVPEGTYDLVCWHPNWKVKGHERNQESFRIQQVRFEDPIRVRKSVTVRPETTTEVKVTLPVTP